MSEEIRKLAAIMFTDIVGYSALTQKNEALALELLNEHRKLSRPMFSKYRGREIKTIGDAFMVEFESTLDAVRCSIDMQRVIAEYNAAQAPERRIEHRIGIHVGDVVFRENDVLGDGVNIAARIQPLAEPGGICISEDVARQIQNKIELPLMRLGRGELKNIKLPVTIYRVALPWKKKHLPFAQRLEFAFKRRRKKILIALIPVAVVVIVFLILMLSSRPTSAISNTIAVLPFSNMSESAEDEYFSDGITDDILTQLWKTANLKVISRTSVMQYKGTKKTIRDIGKELNAGVILEGSVRRAGNRVRVTAQLIDANTDEHLWAETYDKEYQQIFAIQSDVAQKIATALNVKLSPVKIAQAAKKPTDNLEAYNLYLKGRFFWNQRSEPALKKGIDFFQQAIALDPTYALAFSGIADCYSALGSASFLSPDDAFLKAKAAASKALELDSTLAEPHASLGYINFYYDWDWNTAEKQFQTAITLNPNNVVAYDWYSVYLTALERPEEARGIIKKAKDLDPLSVPISTDMGFTLYYSAQYDQAIKELQSTLEMNPRYPLAHLWLGRAFQEKKMYEEAIQEYKKTAGVIVDWPVAIAAIGHVNGMAGNKAEAQKALADLHALTQKKFVTAYGVALVHAALGEKDQAFVWLDKAYEERSNWLVWLKLDPRWVPIRSDPRFIDLVRRVGLPQ